MAYADATFYTGTYLGHPCADSDALDRFLQRASDDIEAVCINGVDISTMEADALVWLKKAVCARTEQYVISGSDTPSGDASGSLGAFSISDSGSDGKAGGLPLDSRTKIYLVHSGLMSRCIGRVSGASYSDWLA